MSSTTVFASTPTKRKRHQTSIIMLTPTKRNGALDGQREDAKAHMNTQQRAATYQEIFGWTLTTEATVACHVRDVLSLQESWHGASVAPTQVGSKSPSNNDFYWLGRIPCRTVRIVGFLVDATQYESRVTYIIDDGTGVIECSERSRPIQRIAEPGKPPPIAPQYPPPSAAVGDCVTIVGKVSKVKVDWQILVNRIERCPVNEELKHYLEVVQLHRTNYSLSEPFPVPLSVKVTPQQKAGPVPAPSTPPRKPAPEDPASHLTAQSSPTSSLASSPVTSIASSPLKSSPVQADAALASPSKLRHPSRLHHVELTRNTFRIYLKYFMDNHDPMHDNDDNSLLDPSFASEEPKTPTKRSAEATPRPSQYPRPVSRPKINRIDFSKFMPASPPSKRAILPELKGYSISYLRRVPELALLASRIAKQEIRAARKLEKEKAKDGKDKDRAKGPSSSKSKSTTRPEKARKPTAKDVKRLFVRAVNDLYREGSIIIWDCPSYSCNSLAMGDNSALWKTSGNSMPSIPNTTTASSITDSNQDDSGNLTDPYPHEDVYLPVKPELLANRLQEIIPIVQKNERRPTAKSGPAQPYRGASSEGLLQYLKTTDDRWSFVRLDSIEDSLEWLEQEGRVWKPSTGQWQLTV